MPNAIAGGLKAQAKLANGKTLTKNEILAYNDMIDGTFRKEEAVRETVRKMERFGLVSLRK